MHFDTIFPYKPSIVGVSLILGNPQHWESQSSSAPNPDAPPAAAGQAGTARQDQGHQEGDQAERHDDLAPGATVQWPVMFLAFRLTGG